MKFIACLIIFASSICMDDHYQLTAPDESGYLHPYDDFLLEGGLPMVHIKDTSGLGKRNFSVLEEGAGSSGAGGFAEEDDAGAERSISLEQSKQTKRVKPTKNKGAAAGVSYKKKAPGVCKDCNTTFKELLYHMISKHNHPSPHSCNNLSCKVGGEPKYFPALALLNKHNVSRHVQESEHKCEPCNKSFPNARELDRHNIRFHGMESEHKCEPCNESFPNASELNRHNVSNHGMEREHKCETCSITFYKAIELTRHNDFCHEKEG